jgi:hypothetical protein
LRTEKSKKHIAVFIFALLLTTLISAFFTASCADVTATKKDSMTFSAAAAEKTLLYTNRQYGFSFTLPKSWKGFKVVESEWTGVSLDGSGRTAAKGPLLSIRNPKWTKAQPYQDIPIMIFTIKQWNALQKDQFAVSAAPIPPSELGRNKTFVFALPARYNYAFPRGFEEVEKILAGKPLKPIAR